MNKSLTHRILVGYQRERTTLGRGFLSFVVYLVTILYCSDIVWSKDLSAYFFCFLPIFDRKFSFFFAFSPSFDWEFSFLFLLSPTLCLGIFLLCFLLLFDWEFSFFVFFRGQGLTFSPWVEVYDKLGFWLKACRTAGHGIGQGLASGSGINGMSHIISMIHMQQ